MQKLLKSPAWNGLLLALFLTSCSSLSNRDILPDLGYPDPADNPAKGKFSARVNQKAYTPIDKGVEFEVEENSQGNFTTIGISAIDKNYNGFSFILAIHESMNNLTGKEIDLSDEYSSAIYQSYGGSLTSLKWYAGKKGYIRFSQLTKKKITGTFVFTAESDSGEEIEISDGSFDLYY